MAVSVASCNGSIFSISLSEVKLILSYLQASVSQDPLCDQLFMRRFYFDNGVENVELAFLFFNLGLIYCCFYGISYFQNM